MQYTYSQLMALWVQAGGSRLYAPIAAAVAMAESGGNSTAINTSNANGSTDLGLWQINSIHGQLSTTNPLANAKAAVKISSGGKNWNPWVAYTTGAYAKYLQKDVTPRTSETGPSVSERYSKDTVAAELQKQLDNPSLVEKVISTTTSVPRFLGALSDTNTWLRVGEGILGVIAIIGGVVMLAKELGISVPLPPAAGLAANLIKAKV